MNRFDVNYTSQVGVKGYTTSNFVMANVYYDFPELLPAVSPFLGAGIGYAHVNAVVSSTGPNQLTYFSTNNNVFSYQGTVGLGYNFSENYALNTAYRYVATDKIDGLGKMVQAHLASVGVSYHFDKGTYK